MIGGAAPVDGNITRRVVYVILVFLVARLILSAFFPVSIDEAYAIVVSRVPSLSYFDHPALAFNFSRASIWLFGSEALFIARLPHVLSGALTTWLLYLVTRGAFGERAGYWAVIFYSIAPFFFISSGMFVVPDGPLNLFLLAALVAVLPMLLGQPNGRPVLRWALGGLMLALALVSKYQAVLFGISAAGFLVFNANGRRQLATAGPWIAFGIAALGLVPTVAWNAAHDFTSFAFQSGRTGTRFEPVSFTVTMLGQMMYVLPVAWAASYIMMWRGLRSPGETSTFLFAIIGALPILVFDAIALMSRNSMPHWPMAGFLFCFPLVGLWATRLRPAPARVLMAVIRLTAVSLVALAALFALHANTALLTRHFNNWPATLDLTWRDLRWDALAEDFQHRGISADPDAFLVATDWSAAARAAYFIGPDLPVAPALADPRHFAFMNEPRLDGRDKGYGVTAAALGTGVDKIPALVAALQSDYSIAGEPWILTQDRAGYPSFDIVVVPIRPH